MLWSKICCFWRKKDQKKKVSIRLCWKARDASGSEGAAARGRGRTVADRTPAARRESGQPSDTTRRSTTARPDPAPSRGTDAVEERDSGALSTMSGSPPRCGGVGLDVAVSPMLDVQPSLRLHHTHTDAKYKGTHCISDAMHTCFSYKTDKRAKSVTRPIRSRVIKSSTTVMGTATKTFYKTFFTLWRRFTSAILVT